MKDTEDLDENGAFVFVSCGISQGEVWMSVRQRKTTSGTKRIKTPRLPLREVRADAQRDLDEYAKTKGWQEYDPSQPEKQEEPQPVKEIPSAPKEKQIDLCGRCLPLFVEAFPFYQITKGETGKDKCGSCGKRKEITTCLYRRKECSFEAA